MAKQKREIVAVFSAQNKAKGVMAGFRSGLDKTGAAMKRMAKVGAVMAAAAAAGLAYLVKRQMEAIDVIAKLSDRLGIATEDLIGLQHAAEISGVSTEALNKSLEMFVRRLGEMTTGSGEAQRGLEMLGLTGEELIRLSPAKAMGIAADRINQLETQAEKAAAAYYLFGRAGAQLVNMFAVGSEGLREFQKEAERLGLTFSRFEAAQIEAANDALTRMRSVMTGLFRQITIQFAPYIEALADKFVEAATAGEGMGANVVDAFESMSMSAIRFGGLIQTLPAYWKGIEAGARETLATIYDIAAAATNLDVLFKKLKRPGWEKTYKELAEEQRQIAAGLLEEGGRQLAGTYGRENAVRRYFDSLRKKAVVWQAAAGISPAKELALLPPAPELDRERKSAIEGIIKYVAATEKEIEIAKRVAQGHLYAAKMIGLENEIKKAGIEDTASAIAVTEAYIKRLEVLGRLKETAAAKAKEEAAAMERESTLLRLEMERWDDVARAMETSFANAFEAMAFEGKKFGDVMKTVLREIFMETVRIMVFRRAALAFAGTAEKPGLLQMGFSALMGGLFPGGGGGTIPGAGTEQMRLAVAPHAEGGIVRRPTIGLLGERGAEAIVPLSGGRSIPVEMRGGGGERRILEINVQYHGQEKPEISAVEEYVLSDRRIIEVTMRAAETDGPYRRSIKQASRG